MKFEGSIVALITPMNSHGEVDYEALNRLVDFHVQSGTHGIVNKQLKPLMVVYL